MRRPYRKPIIPRGRLPSPPGVSAASTTPTERTSFSNIEIEEIVAMVRLNRYNRGRPHGANAVLQEIKSMAIRPLPSLSSVARILTRLGFTHGRTGHYP